jgi:hypothetical protein
MKISSVLVILALSLTVTTVFAQNYSGPAQGSVASGVTVATDNFTRVSPLIEPGERGIRNIIKGPQLPLLYKRLNNTQAADNYIEDPSVGKQNPEYENAMAVLLKSYNGISETNSIPPDPYVAVGPDHVIAVVNSNFAIWDKEGNLLKQIDAADWYSTALPGASPFDPKILYDHFAERWIMVWLHQSDPAKAGYYLVSVSDNSDPLGNWYNWALPSDYNGDEEVDNWGDYQGVGFNKDAIFISSNQFGFESNFQYVKIRIIGKAQLYDNTAGQVIWTDLWDIGYPTGGPQTIKAFNIRPSITYDESSDFYLLHAPNSSTGIDFMTVYNISDPLTNPSLAGALVPVNFYQSAPNADQLDGGAMKLEVYGSYLQNEPKIRNGNMWAVHTVRNAVAPEYTSVRYLRIDLGSLTRVEDIAMGAPNYWFFYPAITVDKDLNVAITYSRSATTEYAGAYYTYRTATDPAGLRGSHTLQTGKANYVKDYGSERNRWGDYNGIWLDPSDDYSMWMFTEYASAKNTWGTWMGKIRIAPFTGVYSFLSETTVDFKDVEVNTRSKEYEVVLANYGTDDLIIQGIPAAVGPFNLVNSLTLPLTLGLYDSLILKFSYNPADTGVAEVDYPITTNTGVTLISLKGDGYEMLRAENDILYASSGVINDGLTLTLNKETGSGTVLGVSNFDELSSIAMNPYTRILYGVNNKKEIVRVNAGGGDAYILFPSGINDLNSIAIDTSGQMFAAQRTGEIYSVNLQSGEFTFLSKAKIPINDMTFNPFTNELWAAMFFGKGIFKVDYNTGDTVRVGNPGTGLSLQAVTFGSDGTVYGLSGSSSQVTNLIQVDTVTGNMTLIGSTGYKNLTGLAHSMGKPLSADNKIIEVPSEFALNANYPNPFNPATVISFSLPEASHVKLAIYNLLGENVEVLLNSDQVSGNHKVDWNVSGSNLSSGIYFYELKAKGKSGKEYSSIRKMVLLK